MTSPKAYQDNSQSGFTLIEVIVSIGILALLAGLGLFLSMDFYRSYAFNYEQNLVVGLVQKARSQAMANIDQDKHCAWIQGSNYILAKGSACTTGDAFPKGGSMTVDFLPNIPVVFNQLDGSVTTPVNIRITGQGKTANITINNEGQIDW
jgi:prepilin-type N-terminal cleavage/methylation domain-containing protein